MSDVIKTALTALIYGARPGPAAIRDCFNEIMDGAVSDAQMGAFLTALQIGLNHQREIANMCHRLEMIMHKCLQLIFLKVLTLVFAGVSQVKDP